MVGPGVGPCVYPGTHPPPQNTPKIFSLYHIRPKCLKERTIPQKIFSVPHSPEVYQGTVHSRLSSVFRTNCLKEHPKDSTQTIYGFPALTSFFRFLCFLKTPTNQVSFSNLAHLFRTGKNNFRGAGAVLAPDSRFRDPPAY